MRDEKIIVATIHNYGDVLGCGIRGELVHKFNGSGLQVLVKGSERNQYSVRHTLDLYRVSTGCLGCERTREPLTRVEV